MLLFEPSTGPAEYIVAKIDNLRPVLEWWQMVRMEPRLANLKAAAAADGRRLRFDRRRRGYWNAWEDWKRRVSGLVGWYAADERLSSSECYETAVREILGAFERGRGD